MVAIPFNDSLIIAKMGDRANPSKRFNSRVLVMNTRRTDRKYQIKNGNTNNTNGNVVTVVATAPITTNANVKKSNSVGGNWSSIIPISALNRFNIRPKGFVSKNCILVRKMALVIWLCKFCDARIVQLNDTKARKIANIITMILNPMIRPITDQSICSAYVGRLDHRPMTTIVNKTEPCVMVNKKNNAIPTHNPPMALI